MKHYVTFSSITVSTGCGVFDPSRNRTAIFEDVTCTACRESEVFKREQAA